MPTSCSRYRRSAGAGCGQAARRPCQRCGRGVVAHGFFGVASQQPVLAVEGGDEVEAD